ncbi:hypothetical protein A4A49_25427 [Nicotiana attenuata]|uniref:Uncharacterized protein n=1 Tax=Nicotiana attenuata TaxID=49451 RepID=A0A1J6HWM7_NICAT|nr:hypothetical protein A4A49_25427 [Nicotiana attenuata]
MKKRKNERREFSAPKPPRLGAWSAKGRREKQKQVPPPSLVSRGGMSAKSNRHIFSPLGSPIGGARASKS